MSKHEIITYRAVMERLKNVPLEQYSPEDIYQRYILYGTTKELSNTKIQSLIIENGYTEYLVKLLEELPTNETIIAQMLNSECFKKNYSIKRGIIEDIETIRDIEEPSTLRYINITLFDIETKKKCPIQYVIDKDRDYQFCRTYMNEYTIMVVRNAENANMLCCCLKTNKEVLNNQLEIEDILSEGANYYES